MPDMIIIFAAIISIIFNIFAVRLLEYPLEKFIKTRFPEENRKWYHFVLIVLVALAFLFIVQFLERNPDTYIWVNRSKVLSVVILITFWCLFLTLVKNKNIWRWLIMIVISTPLTIIILISVPNFCQDLKIRFEVSWEDDKSYFQINNGDVEVDSNRSSFLIIKAHSGPGSENVPTLCIWNSDVTLLMWRRV